ncbi:LuxR family transcriptional regulator [Microbulbifer sp.]|uniref:LuxR family transcriptional regulator n=1 Tax=Microbulbifer sp. TaxID=1908541 RepID=UPI00258A1B91|nr:LuxR family transcriptional regulator [Microbulbifer sp.]
MKGSSWDVLLFPEIVSSRSQQDLEGAISRWVESAGFKFWIYAQGLPRSPLAKDPLIFGNYPESWINHYFEHGYVHIDPVIPHCSDHVTPYIWPSRNCSQQKAATRKFFGEARSFRLLSGITFPLHGPGTCRGLLSVAADEVGAIDLSRWTPDMMLMGSFVHESVIRIRKQNSVAGSNRLTPREQECLTWAAVGKSSWEIGQLLKISERTANFHLYNINKKFGVASRQSAIARAVSLGLISL